MMNNRKQPSAPPAEYGLNVPPTGRLYPSLPGMETKTCSDVNFNNNYQDKSNQYEKTPITGNELGKQSPIKRIRNDTMCSTGSGDSFNGSENETDPVMRRRIRKRRLIRGVSITAWVLAGPLMIGLNLLRGIHLDEDEDDKQDDPLRPWHYKIKYIAPHKR